MEQKKLTKILICCHKPCELPKDDIFLPIQVGAAISNVKLGIQRDDQVDGKPCDNISEKNQSYCELTAMYWAWKNIKKLYPDLEYIGLNHYRRYFDFDHPNAIQDLFVRGVNETPRYSVNREKLVSLLRNFDGIIAKRKQYQYPLYIDYCLCHISDDLRTLRAVIAEKFTEYLEAFDSVLMRNGALAHYNMNIVGWNTFDEYCTWVFSVLEETEKRIDISHYNNVQKRIFGYMAERLWNVYVVAKKIHVKELPVLWYVDDKTQHSLFYRVLTGLWGNLTTWLLSFPNNSAKRFIE